jgi:hypothetical protein
LTFAVSGMLWNRSLVMIDRETESLWSHLLGEAMQGPLKGSVLTQHVGILSFAHAWRQFHPDSRLLSAEPAGP